MKVNRNEQCPCQSGKKYKKCCLIPKKGILKKISAIPITYRLRAFAGLFIIAGAWLIFVGVMNAYRSNDSLSWPSAEGVITSSYVEEYEDMEGDDQIEAHVSYQFYSQAGAIYNNSRVTYGTVSTEAYSTVARYPEGKSVVVYYKANDPEVSVLEPGLRRQLWFLPIFGFVFLSVGCLLWFLFKKLIP